MTNQTLVGQSTDVTIQQFVLAFIHGCHTIVRHQDHLNAINVFPVADKDTGNNIATTLKGLLKKHFKFDSVKEFLKQVAEHTFDSARGNSGVLFSILLDGMSKASHDAKDIRLEHFIELFESGYRALKAEVKQIAQGTMVTIIGDFSDLLRRIPADSSSIADHLTAVMPELEKALERGKEQLPVLKKNNVVDAGAKAFVYFVEGFHQALLNPHKALNLAPIEEELEEVEDPHGILNEKPNFRYCTEALVNAPSCHHDKIQSLIDGQGDSHLCRSHGDKLRFHLHCDEPWHLFERLTAYGRIERPKVDDMLRQFEAGRAAKGSVALLADSSVDLPDNLMDEYGVHLVPINISFIGNEMLDGLCLSPDFLYEKLSTVNPYPQTATPSMGVIKDRVDFLSQHYEHIVIVSLGSALSGTYEAFKQVVKDKAHVTLLDSRRTSGAHALLLEYVADLVAKGTRGEELKQAFERQIEKTNLMVTVGNMEAMVRSGRINALQGLVAKCFNLKPVFTLDSVGKAQVLGKSISLKKAKKRFLKTLMAKHRQQSFKRYAIMHVQNEAGAADLAQYLEQELGFKPAFINNATPCLGLHAGLGTLAVAYLQ